MSKSHGFLFVAAMVRAVLNGTKWQTRRLPTRRNCRDQGKKMLTKEQWDGLDWTTAMASDFGISLASKEGRMYHLTCI